MIYLVRHGETDWNKEGKIQGKADICLNSVGIKQAQEVAEKLKNIKFSCAYCSPRTRAVETCKIICADNAILDERLSERDFGSFEGSIIDKASFTEMWDEKKEYMFPDVETLSAINKRVSNFLDEIKERHKKEDNVLLVCHGGTGFFVKLYFCGKPADGDYKWYLLANGEVATFSL